MIKEKVNTRTDGRTTDNRPWHKLAGLRPVELKNGWQDILVIESTKEDLQINLVGDFKML